MCFGSLDKYKIIKCETALNILQFEFFLPEHLLFEFINLIEAQIKIYIEIWFNLRTRIRYLILD